MRENKVVDCALCGMRRICFPGRVATEHRASSCLPVHRRKISKGAVLFRSGEHVRSLFVLRSGCVKEVATAGAGSPAIVNFCLPGEMPSLQSAGAQSFEVTGIAVEPTSFCEVPLSAFHRLCEQSPEVAGELIKLVARSAAATQELLIMVRSRKALAQVAGFLLNMSARLYARGLREREFRLGMSRLDIANYLGLTNETVSRCFSELSRRELVQVHAKRVQLLEPDKLQRVAQGD